MVHARRNWHRMAAALLALLALCALFPVRIAVPAAAEAAEDASLSIEFTVRPGVLVTPGGGLYNGKRITDVNKRYAASSTWDDKVCRNMAHYYAVIAPAHNARLEQLK